MSYTSMTIDKNGIIYMGTETLVSYNPHTKQLTELGKMPFYSAGDLIFYKDKLLLAGWDPQNWTTGIFEITPLNLPASKLYMSTPPFIGLLSFPVPCGNNRYFGLSSDGTTTNLVELDFINKTVIGYRGSIDAKILDAASITESGIENKVAINSVVKTNLANCSNSNGSIAITASSLNGPVTYTLLNTGISQASGNFTNLRGGIYRFRISDATGCSTDTSITLTENIPAGGCNDIFIPNAFTPNNDGRNDIFSVITPAIFKDMSLQVFNRWGSMVHQSKGSNIAWDGNNKGTQQPAGIYIYTISYTDQFGEKKR
ncbi:MAG: gliding motility-associated C-terminal domain-containing protein [Bacteroidota bacterium]